MSWFDRNWYSTRAKSTAPYDRNQKQAISTSFMSGSPGLSRTSLPEKQKPYGYRLGSVPSLRMMRWSKSLGGITKNKSVAESSLLNSSRSSLLRSSILDRPCTVKISAPKRTFNTNVGMKSTNVGGGLFSNHVLSNSTTSLNSPYSMDKVVSSLKDFDTKLTAKRSCSQLTDILDTPTGVVKKRRKVESCTDSAAESKVSSSAEKCPKSSPEKQQPPNDDSSLPLLSLSKGYQGFWQDAALLASLSTSRKWLTEVELKESLPTVNSQECDNVYSLSRCTTPDSAQDSEVSMTSSTVHKNSSVGAGGDGGSRTPSVANYSGCRLPYVLSSGHSHLVPDKMTSFGGETLPLYTHKVILREVSTNTDPDWMTDSAQALKEKRYAEDVERDRQAEMERVNRLLGIETPKTQVSTFALASNTSNSAPTSVTSSNDVTQSTKSSADQPTMAAFSQPTTLSTFSSSIAAKVQKPASDSIAAGSSPKIVQFAADDSSTKAFSSSVNGSPAGNSNSSLFKNTSSPQVISTVAPAFTSLATFAAKTATSGETTDSKTSAIPVAGSEKPSLFGSLTSSVVPSSTPNLTFGAKEQASMNLLGGVQSSPSTSLAAAPTTTATSLTPFSFTTGAPSASTESKISSNFAFGSFAPASKTDSSSSVASIASVATTAPMAPATNTLSSLGENSALKQLKWASEAPAASSTPSSLTQTFACGVVGGGTSGPPVFGFGKVDSNASGPAASSSLFGSKPEMSSSTSLSTSSVKPSLPSFSFNSTPVTTSSTLFGNSPSISSNNFAFGSSANTQNQQTAVKPASQLGSFEKPTASTGSVLGASNLFGSPAQTTVASITANTSSSSGAMGMFKFGAPSSATSNGSSFAFGASPSTQSSSATTTSGFTFGASPATQSAATTSSFAFGSNLGTQNLPASTTSSTGFTFGAASNQNAPSTASSTFGFGASATNQNTSAPSLFGGSLNTFTSSQTANALTTPFGASAASTSGGIFGSASTTGGASAGTSSIFGNNSAVASGSSEPFGSSQNSSTAFGSSVAPKPLAFGASSSSAASLFSAGAPSQNSSGAAPSIFGATNSSTPSGQSIFGQGSNAPTAASAPTLPGVGSFTFGAAAPTQQMNSTPSPAAPLFQFGGAAASGGGGMTFGASNPAVASGIAANPIVPQDPAGAAGAGAFSIGTTGSSDSSLPNRRIRTATRKSTKTLRK